MYVHNNSFDTEDLMVGILHIREKSSVHIQVKDTQFTTSRSTYCCYYNFPKHNILSQYYHHLPSSIIIIIRFCSKTISVL